MARRNTEERKEYQREWAQKNREHIREYMRAWNKTPAGKASAKRRAERRRLERIANPEKFRRLTREAKFRHRYGITTDEYDQMFAAQGGVCAVCGRSGEETKQPLHVDHCHLTGRVRELLCVGCNTALGSMVDNADWLDALAAYARKWTT